MSHTFYDSPEDSPAPRLSIDVTYEYAWFFEHDHDGKVTGVARVPNIELPAIAAALNAYLAWRKP